MKIHAILFLCLLMSIQQTTAQKFLNLGFEKQDSTGRPLQWSVFLGEANASSQKVTTDPATKSGAGHSLRLESGTSAKDNIYETIILRNRFPVVLARGKKITYSAWIRTEQVSDDTPDLWWRVDRGTGATNTANLKEKITGTTEWKKYSTQIDVDADATDILFGISFSGKGTVWVDQLEILIDGKKYTDANTAPAPAEKELSWVRRNSIPLKSTKMSSGMDDLHAVRQLVGNARIVGLGEATHGTEEFVVFRNRLFEFLVREMGFTLIALEMGSMADFQQANRYVLLETDTIAADLFFVASTELIEWMRNYNREHLSQPGFKPVQFAGLDVYADTVTVHQLKKFVSIHDPAQVAQFDALLACQATIIDTWGTGDEKFSAAALRFLEAARKTEAYFKDKKQVFSTAVPAAEYAWIEKYVDLLLDQAIAACKYASVAGFSGDESHRDRGMAENVAWLLEQNPGAKILVYAHNGHVAKDAGVMGGFLAQKFGNDYITLASTAHAGAFSSWQSDNEPMVASQPGSCEYYIHKAAQGNCIIDIRNAKAGSRESGWLLRPLDFRSVGAEGGASQFEMIELPKVFDGIVFINESSPVRRIK